MSMSMSMSMNMRCVRDGVVPMPAPPVLRSSLVARLVGIASQPGGEGGLVERLEVQPLPVQAVHAQHTHLVGRPRRSAQHNRIHTAGRSDEPIP